MTSLSEAEGGRGHCPLDPGLIDLFSCIAASLLNNLTYLLTYLLTIRQINITSISSRSSTWRFNDALTEAAHVLHAEY